MCPFVFSLFVVIKLNKNKYILEKDMLINQDFKSYKFKCGKIENLSNLQSLYYNFYELKNYYYALKLFFLKDKTNKKFKKNLIINFDEFNKHIYLDPNFQNLIQFIELNLDLKKNVKVIFLKKQIFKFKYLKFLNIYLIDLIRSEENLVLNVI